MTELLRRVSEYNPQLLHQSRLLNTYRSPTALEYRFGANRVPRYGCAPSSLRRLNSIHTARRTFSRQEGEEESRGGGGVKRGRRRQEGGKASKGGGVGKTILYTSTVKERTHKKQIKLEVKVMLPRLPSKTCNTTIIKNNYSGVRCNQFEIQSEDWIEKSKLFNYGCVTCFRGGSNAPSCHWEVLFRVEPQMPFSVHSSVVSCCLEVLAEEGLVQRQRPGILRPDDCVLEAVPKHVPSCHEACSGRRAKRLHLLRK